MGERSIVEYFAEHERYACGYCKSADTCYSHGMWGHYLTPQDYQNLIDRGWRRSGKYVYKPMLNLTCCPQYTIRCNALEFKLSRSQKKAVKRMNKYLAYGQMHNEDSEQNSTHLEDAHHEHMDIPSSVHVEMKECRGNVEDDVQGYLLKKDRTPVGDSAEQGKKSEACPILSKEEKTGQSATPKDAHEPNSKDIGADRPRCRKAKEIRKERRMQRLFNSGFTAEEVAEKMEKKPKCNEKSIEDFLSECPVADPVHKLRVQLVQVDKLSMEFQTTLDASHAVYKRYQMLIHNESENQCDKEAYQEFMIHASLKLCRRSTSNIGFGLYHQQYWLDDKLIAVGVLDILPYCVSSVYLYYDPDYSFLSLGRYSALREIALTRELHRTSPELKYYYMGFYIHTNQKMRYKGSYTPSFLLCPETYNFIPIEKCLPKLEISKYSRLEQDSEKRDPDGVVQLEEVMILHQRDAMPYPFYRQLKSGSDDDDEPVVRQYANLVGRKCYQRMLLYRS